MILNHITILNYKNIKEAELDFSPNINCFVGSNGEGKTNVLDAIYFLSFTKSATNAVDSQNVRHGEEFFMIQGLYDLNGNPEEVSCGLKLHQKKQFKRNKKAYKKLAEHIDNLYDVSVVGTQISDDMMEIYVTAKERRCIDRIKCEFTLNNNYL